MLKQFADLHCDTLWRCFEERRTLHHPSLQVRPSHSFSLLQNYAIYIPDHVADPIAYFRAVYDHGRMLFEQMPNYRFCKNFGEIEASLAEGARPCIISIEGGCLFSGNRERDLKFVMELKEKGIAFLSLCYNGGNALAGGFLCPEKGLSESGKQAASLLHEFNISLDLSHLNHRSADALLDFLPSGMAATHSNCYSLMPHPRNLTDEQIQAISEKEGLIGINFYPPFLVSGEASSDDVLRHLDFLERIGAENTIAFGSDFDGIEKSPVDLRSTDDYPQLYDKIKKKASNKADDYCFSHVMNYLCHNFK